MSKQTRLSVLLLSCFTLSAQAANWSDTAITYSYGKGYTEPPLKEEFSKQIVALSHISTYQYGSNFFNGAVHFSNGIDKKENASKGAQEIYLVYRHQLQWGKITQKPAAFGPIKDLGLTAGVDINSKDNKAQPRKRALVIGPTLKWDVPGVLDTSLLFYKESNHNSGGINKDVTFKSTYMLNATWNIPFQIGSAPVKFQGMLNHIGPKGKNYWNVDTKAETLLRTSLMFDVSQPLTLQKGTLYVGVGYEYWHNKFGAPGGVGTRTSTPTINAEWHF